MFRRRPVNGYPSKGRRRQRSPRLASRKRGSSHKTPLQLGRGRVVQEFPLAPKASEDSVGVGGDWRAAAGASALAIKRGPDPRYGVTNPAFAVPRLDTIAAVATAVAPGQGGIAVIRLSGPVAEQVGQAVVRCPGRQEWGSHRILYGHVMAVDGQRRLDEVLLLSLIHI